MSTLPNALRRLCYGFGFHVRRLPPTPVSRHNYQFHQPSASFSASSETQPSQSSAPKSEEELKISERAVERLKTIASSGDCLRVLVDSGGCSGFEYKFQLVSAPDADDRVFEKEGVRVVVDEISLDFLRGATIDYQVELIKAAFRIVQNPKAEKGCSCGASFALKAAPTSEDILKKP